MIQNLSLKKKKKSLRLGNTTFCYFNIPNREMLTNTLRVLVNNSFKENFYGKKKTINILTVFFIFYKNGVKTFLK